MDVECSDILALTGAPRSYIDCIALSLLWLGCWMLLVLIDWPSMRLRGSRHLPLFNYYRHPLCWSSTQRLPALLSRVLFIFFPFSHTVKDSGYLVDERMALMFTSDVNCIFSTHWLATRERETAGRQSRDEMTERKSREKISGMYSRERETLCRRCSLMMAHALISKLTIDGKERLQTSKGSNSLLQQLLRYRR